MLSVIVLICSMSQVPDHSACEVRNALMSQSAGEAEDGASCMTSGMFFLAAHYSLDAVTEYGKVICRPPLVDLDRQRG